MRSVDPMPGNPWPHDMVLRIQDDEQSVLDLLWIRATWGLAPRGDVPPQPEIAPDANPTVQSLRRDKGEWETAWSELWSAVLAHLGRPYREDEFEELEASEVGSDERRRLFETMIGPTWRGRFGSDGFGDEYHAWMRSISHRRSASRPRRLEDDPERRDLGATIAAWERGLETIVTIPCIGEYTRTITATGLCVTSSTRADPDAYSRALRAFGR